MDAQTLADSYRRLVDPAAQPALRRVAKLRADYLHASAEARAIVEAQGSRTWPGLAAREEAWPLLVDAAKHHDYDLSLSMLTEERLAELWADVWDAPEGLPTELSGPAQLLWLSLEVRLRAPDSEDNDAAVVRDLAAARLVWPQISEEEMRAAFCEMADYRQTELDEEEEPDEEEAELTYDRLILRLTNSDWCSSRATASIGLSFLKMEGFAFRFHRSRLSMSFL
jgi:hypothetical protein